MNFFKNVLEYNYYLSNTFKLFNVIHYVSNIVKREPTESEDYLGKITYTLSINKMDGQKYKNSVFDIPYKNSNIYRRNKLLPNKEQIWYKYGVIHRDNDLPAKIALNGDESWYKYGKLHRDNDLPAKINKRDYRGYFIQEWYVNDRAYRDNDLPTKIMTNIRTGETIKEWREGGKFGGVLHRGGNRPAMEVSNGDKYWYENGEYINDNTTPTILKPDGTKEWRRNGELSRTNPYSYEDLPSIVRPDGTREWYKYGYLFRDEDNYSPAIIKGDGTREWYEHGRLNRRGDKPAIIKLNKQTGEMVEEWYKNGKLKRKNDLPTRVVSNINDFENKNEILITNGYYQ